LFQELVKKRDFYAGVLMTLAGSAVTTESFNYTLGTLTHMGPGMFPLILGISLAFVGILILGMAAVSPDQSKRILPDAPNWLAWGCILAGPILFIILGKLFGLVAATFACVFVPSLGDRNTTLKGSVILAAAVTFFGVLLFSLILKVQFPLFSWNI
jgi:hypothetical protein